MNRPDHEVRPALPTPAVPIPPVPRTLTAAELPPLLLHELILKHLRVASELPMPVLAQRLGLTRALVGEQLELLRRERLVEVRRRGTMDTDVNYSLTQAGQERAGLALENSQYIGIAPVPLSQYREQVQRQALARPFHTQESLAQAFSELVVPERLHPILGAALNSGRTLYLWGDSGTGKSYLAERLAQLIGGQIWVPHALLVGDQIVSFYDPLCHRCADGAAEAHPDTLPAHDARWRLVARPSVFIGGELTLDELELQFDEQRRCYTAPPQLLANNGVLVIDDLGRQRVDVTALLNRWIVPLDRRRDLLRLHNGTRFEVPFEVMVVFSSNLAPEALADPAFTRRLGYRVRLEELLPDDYQRIVERECARHGLEMQPQTWQHLLALHRRSGVPLLPTHPRDLFAILIDEARYQGHAAQWTPEAMAQAWALHFDSEATGSLLPAGERPPQRTAWQLHLVPTGAQLLPAEEKFI